METTLRSIELDRVIELISLEARSAPGKQALARRTPARELATCERRQSELVEMVRLVATDGLLPLGGLTDVAPLLRTDATLELAESWEALRAVRACQSLRETFLRTDTFPHLRTIAEKIDDHSQLVQSVGRYFTDDGKLREEASPALRTLRSRMSAKRNAIQKTLTDLMSRHADALQEPIITMRGDRYCIPVRAERRGEVSGILHERSGSGASFFIEPIAVVEANNDLAQLRIEEREEIARIVRFVSGQLLASSDSIKVSVEIAGELDAIQACAVVFQRIGASRPRFTDERRLVLLEARHPLLDERLADLRRSAFGESDSPTVVPTTFALEPERPALVISGPNAGGKTVAIKTAGLLTAMAACGFPLPADDGSIIPAVDRIFILVGDDQNVIEHLSTFSAYLLRLRRILESATERSLILLDELGSGTDPEEGAALAASVIEELLDRNSLFVITTHVSAVKSFALSDKRIENASMEFDAKSGKPTFRLIVGVPGRSRAIEAAERAGLPSRVIEAARKRLGMRYGEVDALLAELHRLAGESLRERDALRSEKIATAAERDSVVAERKKLEEERRRLSASLRDDVDRIRDEVGQRLQNEIHKLRASDRSAIQKAKAADIAREVTRPLEAIEQSDEASVPRVGERVQHRKFKIEGELKEIEGDKAYVALGGKRMQVDLADLRRVGKATERAKELKQSSAPAPPAVEPEIGAELNLIGQRVDDAIEESDRFLDRSLLEGKEAVRLIHGFGTGALRKALREHLRKHPAVKSFRAGTEREGGDGATVAILDV